MTAADAITNEDIMGVLQEMMQMTSDNFVKLEDRMDGLEGKMDGLDGRMGTLEARMSTLEDKMDNIEAELKAINARLKEHDLRLAELKQITERLLNEHEAYKNDIRDILDRIVALENRAPEISKKELRELQSLLQKVVDWALEAAKVIKVPIKIQS